MSTFNRNDAEKELTSEENAKLRGFKEGLEQDLELAEFSEAERQQVYNTLMDYQTCYLCEEHYRVLYNEQAEVVEDLLNNPYKGNDKKKQQEYMAACSEERAKLEALENQYNEYHSLKIDMEEEAKKADVKLDTRLAERGLKDEPAKAPQNGPTAQKQNSPKKR